MDQVNFDLGVTLPEVSKALSEDDNGDLHIEGIAADFNPDRQNDVMMPGALDDAIGRYLSSGGPLLYHHKRDQQLGQVTDMKPGPNGVAIKAVIPKPSDPVLKDKYDKIKRGMLRGLSIFGPALVAPKPGGGRWLGRIDLQETSITPQPVAPGALFDVVSKALEESPEPTPEELAEFQERFDKRYDELLAKLAPADE